MQATSYAVGPDSPPVRDLTIGDLLRQAAEEVPDRVALISGLPNAAERHQWTYAETYDESLKVARALASRWSCKP